MSTSLNHALLLDTAWFHEHPKAECYLRPMFAEERRLFGLDNQKHVLVTRVGRGVKHKLPLRLYSEHDGMPAELLWTDTGERWHIRASGEVVPKRKTSREAWQAFLDPETQSMIKMGREMLGGKR